MFIFCKKCGDFDKEVITKKDVYKFCPMCGKTLTGVKIPGKTYLKAQNEIKSIGINMWVGIETTFIE